MDPMLIICLSQVFDNPQEDSVTRTRACWISQVTDFTFYRAEGGVPHGFRQVTWMCSRRSASRQVRRLGARIKGTRRTV
jgi:hypothetical protein